MDRPNRGPLPERVLSKLYLTLFLRGSSVRGLSHSDAPTSVGKKLARTLALYALGGLVALVFWGQPVLSLSFYLHSATFLLLGTAIMASAGDLLFNPEESDILLHRPVTPRALLFGKVSALCRVAFWLAGALNGVGLIVGLATRDGGVLYLLAHVLSTGLETLFVAGLVVLMYELCLRRLGRERLDAFITAARVLGALGFVFAAQAPSLLLSVGGGSLRTESPWLWFAPPAWFAAIDDGITGSGAALSWLRAGIALVATAAVLWVAVDRLAATYQVGLQRLAEAPAHLVSRPWMQALVEAPPLSWWLRSPAERASALLCLAYLSRDRDTKLRTYPVLASLTFIPLLGVLGGATQSRSLDVFMVSFAGACVALIAYVATDLLTYSQQFRAAEVFHQAPLQGPASLARGVRAAVLVFVVAPSAAVVTALVLASNIELIFLIFPGLVAAPAFACVQFGRVPSPLSRPSEEGRPEARWGRILSSALAALVLAGVVGKSWHDGWFRHFSVAEVPTVAAVCWFFTRRARSAHWPRLE